MSPIPPDHCRHNLTGSRGACGELPLPVIGTRDEFQGVKVNVIENSRRAMVRQHTGKDVNWPQGLIEGFFSNAKKSWICYFFGHTDGEENGI